MQPRARINCPEGLGNRVAALANALTWHSSIEFAWDVNEHCPLGWQEVFPKAIMRVDFVAGDGASATDIGGRPCMDWDAARCRVHARSTYARVVAAIGAQARPEAPSVAIVARFHRATSFDLPRLVKTAGFAAHQAGVDRVFLLADRYREDIQILARRLTETEIIEAAAPELITDLARAPEATRAFVQDWRTALAARHIVTLDGPTSLLHPARAAGICIRYA